MESIITDNTLTLENVHQQFQDWRASRASRREPIPEYLWQAAADLCTSHSVNRVCRHLRLSHDRLKKRVSGQNSPSPDFMELDFNTLARHWQIECSRPDGTRLKISGTGTGPQVSSILEAFFS